MATELKKLNANGGKMMLEDFSKKEIATMFTIFQRYVFLTHEDAGMMVTLNSDGKEFVDDLTCKHVAKRAIFPVSNGSDAWDNFIEKRWGRK